MKKISIVISIYNEKENITKLFNELLMSQIDNMSYEYIFVNDGSTDKSDELIKNICYLNSNVKYIEFTKNYGHEIAMTSGMDFSQGDAVIFMDGDLQHPPVITKQMIEMWNSGCKIVLTRRIDNQDNGVIYKLNSLIYYKIINYLSDFDFKRNYPDFRLIDRYYINIIKKYKEHSRIFRGLIYLIGADSDTKTIDFVAPKRFSGKTKYNFLKLLNLGIDGILSFSIKPLRMALATSFLIFIFAVFFGFFIFIYKILGYIELDGFTSQILITVILGSANLLMLSIVGEYLGKIHIESKGRPLYTIRNLINIDNENNS